MMTNTQLYLSIELPTLLILIGLILNFVLFRDLKTEMKDTRGELGDFRKEMNNRLLIIESDLRQFFSITGKHEGRIDEISKRR